MNFKDFDGEVSVSLDIVTRGGFSWLGLFCHWLDNTYTLRHVLLSLRQLTGAHDGDAIAAALLAELDYYGLLYKVFYL